MLKQLFTDAKQEIKFGYLKRNHPFRYPVLASIEENVPQQRTVVLRDATKDFELILFTDARSPKIKQFEAHPAASLLFYHPKKMLQLKVQGEIKIIRSGKQLADYWDKIQGKSRKDYTTQSAPSQTIKNPDHVDYLTDDNHFCVLKLVPNSIEYLQLKRPNHIRAIFYETNNWEGEFLVP